MKNMLDKFLTNIAKLIDLKSIITIVMIIALVFGFVDNRIEAKDFVVFVNMILIVLCFYITYQHSERILLLLN